MKEPWGAGDQLSRGSELDDHVPSVSGWRVEDVRRGGDPQRDELVETAFPSLRWTQYELERLRILMD